MLEHAPFCERDFKLQKEMETHDQHGDFLVKIKKQGMIYPYVYATHPKSIPAPYHHSNIDSDEILYYVDGDFMSRNNIQKGQLTLHPGVIPHGPHPGAIERSIGKTSTEELAVMIDAFKPMKITKAAYFRAYQTPWRWRKSDRALGRRCCFRVS